MTGLGAATYLGFFAVAALWLFMTSDFIGFRRGLPTGDLEVEDQVQRPVFSNSASVCPDAESFSPDLVSHSSSK